MGYDLCMRHLSKDEIKSLLKEIPNPRQRLMVKVGLLHGLRISETINLKKEDVKDGYVNVQRLKGSMRTIQPYVKHPDPELDESQELAELYKSLQPGERLFPITRDGALKLMKRAGCRAGIPAHKTTNHALKHSIAKMTIKIAGIEMVQQYLGHRSMASTGMYLKADDESASSAVGQAMMI